MSKIFRLSGVIFLTVFIDRPVIADMVSFDFDDIQSQSKRKGAKAPEIEIYMEELFGSDISVSRNTGSAKKGPSAGNNLLQSPLGIENGYLKVGKGRGSGISFDFGANPIDSFSVDWLLRKGGKSFKILADGVVIDQQTLSKAQRKSGLAGHQDSYFFDTPIHKLEFIGVKKKSFAIDNLVINIPLPTSDEIEDVENSANNEGNENNTNQTEYEPYEDENPSENYLDIGFLDNPGSGDNPGITQVAAAVPEPSSLLMLLIGISVAWFSRKIPVRKTIA